MSRKRTATVYKHLPETIGFIQTLINESAAILIRCGDSSQTAKRLSSNFVIDVCRQLSGKVHYFGKNISLNVESTHECIRAGHESGESIKQLAVQYRLSERQIYNVIFYNKDNPPAKAATASAPLIAVSATRMFLKAGMPQADATQATRGLLAVLAAKLGGSGIYVPMTRRAIFILRDIDIFKMHKAGKSISWLATFFNLTEKEIETVIEQFPVINTATTKMSEFPRIRKYVLDVAASFKEINPDVHELLESVAISIERAHELATAEKLPSLGG